MLRAAYRARQFFGALRVGHEDGLEAEEALALLSAEQRALYLQQSPRDRRHALACCRLVRDGEEALRRAALLHDVAKGDLRVVDRVLFVLLSAWAPGLLRRLACERGMRWRRALDAILRHGERGAAAAERVGADAETVRLIRMHHQAAAPGDERLRRLQLADDSS